MIRGFSQILPAAQTQNLVKAIDAYLGDFAALVSLNTVENIRKLDSHVAAIVTAAGGLQSGARGLTESEREVADIICASVRGLDEEHGRYRRSAQECEGQYFARMRHLDVGELVLASVAKTNHRRSFARCIDAGGVGFETMVEADAELLSQALDNILDNAAKYAQTQVVVSLCRMGEWAKITVEDDGPGMDAHEAEGAFVRGVKNPNRTADSTGVGLHFTRQVVEEMHGGSVYIQSARSPTRVVVLLPLEGAAQTGAPEAKEGTGPAIRGRD